MKIGEIITQTKIEGSLLGCVAPRPIQGKITKIGRVNIWIEVPYMGKMLLEIKMKKELFT